MGKETYMACDLNTCCSTAEQNAEAEENGTRGAFITCCCWPSLLRGLSWGGCWGVYVLLYSWVISHSVEALDVCCIHKPHWHQWGKCTEISLTNTIPFVLSLLTLSLILHLSEIHTYNRLAEDVSMAITHSVNTQVFLTDIFLEALLSRHTSLS